MLLYKVKNVVYIYFATLMVAFIPAVLQSILQSYFYEINESIKTVNQTENLIHHFVDNRTREEHAMANNPEQESQKEASTDKRKLPLLFAPNYVITPNYTCLNHGSGMKILILVTTSADHFKRRRAIRFSWGSSARRADVALAFVVGSSQNSKINKQILSESKEYRDIIQCDFADTYRNLTLKTMCSIRYFEKICSKARFLMKVDDDVFVIIENLLKFVETYQHRKLGIWGDNLTETEPFRDAKSKYFMSKEVYPEAIFPDYIAGPAYIMTNKSAIMLSQNAEKETYYNLEDMFFTGFLAEKLLIPRERADNVIHTKRRGVILKNVIAQHLCGVNEMFSLWDYFNTADLTSMENPYKNKPICKQEQ